ncbi:hypothetical protein OCH239_05405 [Roseivivax halodurans JCM 10272]|uniref:Uncharacterized protein n=1 Tax=Roseivivax halodurans JCM 10272 TaxID=1449350 RepID=X7EG43_9RHOB|nr:hypothetical protein [Roseivivax halodurans]ETX14078.1 hypothetical protein OCH239_05405 [Roseivivax halodurans JCM 10272]
MSLRRTLAALVLALAAVLSLSVENPAVSGAERAASRIAVAAGAVYVSLRAINATLSVAQEIEVGGSMVASVNAQPIKVLEPVDDTVERVAAAVFAVSVVAATLSVAVGPLGVLGAGLLLAALVPWFIAPRGGRVGMLLDRAVVAGAALAFVLPLLFWSGAGMADRLTETRLTEARAELAEIADRARGITPEEPQALPEEDGSWFSDLGGDSIGDVWDGIAAYRDSVGYFLSEADTILSASLTVIGLLLLRTLILPLAIVGVALWVMRRRRA